MKKLLKWYAWSGLAVLLLVNIASCGRKGETPVIKQGDVTTTTAESSTHTEKLMPDLPERDFKEYEFTFLTSNPFAIDLDIWNFRDIAAEELNGEVINDAIFNRNKFVEEKYNCKIVENHAGGDYDALFRKSVMADAATFDVYQPRMRGFSTYALEGFILDLHTIPYLNLQQIWWDQSAVRDLELGGKLFGVSGDINVLDNDSTTGIIFNKSLIEQNGLENPYELVRSGKWTIAQLMEYSKVISRDVDGNTTMDYKDAYGFICQRDTLASLFNGAGGRVAEKDKEGYPVMTLNKEKEVTLLEKVFDLMYAPTSYNVHKNLEGKIEGDWSKQMNIMFQDNRVLLMWVRLRDVEAQRTMEADFGILPVPKLDESQQVYYSSVNPYVSPLICVPSSTKDLERTGILLEALAAESHYTLQPAYYDVVLNGKVTRDEDSSEMLDVIFSNRVYDIGDIYNFGDIGSFINMTMKDDRNIASFYSAREKKVLKDIDKLVEDFKKLDA